VVVARGSCFPGVHVLIICAYSHILKAVRHFKAEFFKTLAHPTRIRILDALREAPLTVAELQDALELEQPNVSQHLAMLRAKGLVESAREGTSIRYRVSDRAILKLLDVAREIYERQLASNRAHFEATR
jgi:DNA-binding transcriptional ArsR family regulator